MINESNFAESYGGVEKALESRVAEVDGVRPAICRLWPALDVGYRRMKYIDMFRKLNL
jgi:hypothetical protein